MKSATANLWAYGKQVYDKSRVLSRTQDIDMSNILPQIEVYNIIIISPQSQLLIPYATVIKLVLDMDI